MDIAEQKKIDSESNKLTDNKLTAIITDQPGRVLAVFVFGPILIYKGRKYDDGFLLFFGVLLILWDLYWLLFKEPKKGVAPL